jgi:hypothetical protein
VPVKPVTDATELVLAALELVPVLLLSSLPEHAASVTAQRRTIQGLANFMRFLFQMSIFVEAFDTAATRHAIVLI